MRNILVVIFLLLFSSNLFAQSFKTEYLSLDTSIEKPVVKLSNGLLHLNFPLEKLKDAIILTSNNDPLVILNKRKKIAFSMNTTGKELLLDGFENDPKKISINISDMPSIIFGLKKQIIKNSSDTELSKIISNMKNIMLAPKSDSEAYYSKANGKIAYFLINGEKNHVFVVNENENDYFTIIISDNVNKTDFINLIVKGVLQ
ncbi:MAG: hypothetical protein OQL19_05985 [Gammaproteobacteria bacterium]|nr:hypothetical protein [Gammaproteobacteria bacterium]